MSSTDDKSKSEAMSRTAPLNDGKVPKGSTASSVQSTVDSGQGAATGLSQGMSREGRETNGTYSQSTSAAQSAVDRNKNN